MIVLSLPRFAWETAKNHIFVQYEQRLPPFRGRDSKMFGFPRASRGSAKKLFSIQAVYPPPAAGDNSYNLPTPTRTGRELSRDRDIG